MSEAAPRHRIAERQFDGLAAKAAGIPFLAVCTGKYDRSAFHDSEAIAVIDMG